MNKKFWIFKAIKIAIMVTLFINVAGFGTMYLWNWLMPLLFKLPAITFLQAIGLLVLSKILFGGFRGRGGRFGAGRARPKCKVDVAIDLVVLKMEMWLRKNSCTLLKREIVLVSLFKFFLRIAYSYLTK